MSSPSSVVHSTFAIRRHYPFPADKVFKALSDKSKKRRWQVEGEGFTIESFEMDFRVGGLEWSTFRYHGGPLMRVDASYQDIVPNNRIVFAYSMTVGESRLSSSLATFELLPAEGGTDVVYTEQGAYFEGGQGSADGRKEGSRILLEQLFKELGRPD